MEKWVMHGGQNKVAIEIACIPHAKVLKFLEDEQGDMHHVEWNKSKNLALQENIGKPIIIITLDILSVIQFFIIWVFDVLNDISHVKLCKLV